MSGTASAAVAHGSTGCFVSDDGGLVKDPGDKWLADHIGDLQQDAEQEHELDRLADKAAEKK